MVLMRRVLPLAPFLLVSLAFLTGAFLPGEIRVVFRDALMLSGVDGYAHLIFCFLMAFMLSRRRVAWPYILVFMLGLGALIELIQVWIPGRSPSWDDFWDDGIGTLLGMFFAWFVSKSDQRGIDG